MNENNSNNKDDNISNIEKKMLANVEYAAKSHRPNEKKNEMKAKIKKMVFKIGVIERHAKKKNIA